MYQVDIELARIVLGLKQSSENVGMFDDNPRFESLSLYAISELNASLKFAFHEQRSARQKLRLRLALHLSPIDAIKYDKSRVESRKSLISAHLTKEFGVEQRFSETLSRDIATILDMWDEERNSKYRSNLDHILSRQEGQCSHCHVSLNDSSRIEIEENNALRGTSDPFKPYYDNYGVTSRMAPEVDHIVAISKDGTNCKNNLQVLCNLCNRGKADGFGVSLASELEHAATKISEIPDFHRMKMLYYRIEMDMCRCTKCLSDNTELTVRLRRPSGGYLLSNIRSICYKCV